MPIDQAESERPLTTRRSLLTRAAVGTAIFGVGTAVGPLGLFSTAAGAQEDDGAGLDESSLSAEDFAALAVPLELAAVTGYLEALQAEGLDGTTTKFLRRFQGHHQAVVDTLTPLLPADPAVPDPTPNAEVSSAISTALGSAADQNAVLNALSDLESTIAASHLQALGLIDDKALAKTVGQVLATESQQCAFLAVQGGTPLDQVTPTRVTTGDAAN